MADQSRLDVLEGRVEEQSKHWDRVYGQIAVVDRKIDDGLRDLSSQIAALDDRLSGKVDVVEQTLDRKIDALDQRLDRRFEAVDRRFETIDRQLADLRTELSKQFRWTFSTMLALLGMVLTVAAGVATALLR